MTTGVRQWGFAAVASVAAHLALAAALALTLAPRPVPPEPIPEARFDLSALPVEKVDAISQPTDGAAVPESHRGAPTLPPGSVPVGRSAPVAVTSTQLSATSTSTAVLAGQPPPFQAVTLVPPSGARVIPDAPPAAVLAALQTPEESVRPENPRSELTPPASAPHSVQVESVGVATASLTAAPLQSITAPAAPDPAQSIDTAPIIGETAEAAPTDALRVAAITSDGPVVPGVTAEAAPAASVIAAPDRLRNAPIQATALGVAVPSVEPLVSAKPASLELAGTAPVAEIATVSSPQSQLMPATAPEAPALPAGMPQAPPLPTQPPPAGDRVAGSLPGDLALALAAATASTVGERALAEQAWSGSDEAQIDPVSLAAIQSFMQPSDLNRLGADKDPVRDGISALLGSVPCARMQTVFLPETGTLELRGHVPDEGLRDPVLAALVGQVGGAIPVADNLRVLPRPQCDVLTGIADLGLPQSTVQDTDPRLVGPDAHAREYSYINGETLTFEVTTPDYPAHVYLDYFDAEGMVLHLQPNEMLDTVQMDPKSTLTVGTDASGTEVFRITVSPPFGNEIAVAFAASAPIHDTPRPTLEPAGPYLDWLRERIAAARDADADFKGEWVYFFMSTEPRAQ